MDKLTPKERSANMSRIRSRDTSPEMTVRRLIHRIGFRYRLHAAKLPGKPDIILPRLKRIIDVRGCFWHQHPGCIDAHIPKSRRAYWAPKLKRNQQRDQDNARKLKQLGWKVCVIWECEANTGEKLSKRLLRFLAARPA